MLKQDKYHLKQVRSDVGKAIRKYDLIENGDRILVGLSGGKDSFVLLEILANRRKYTDINYALIACHVDIVNMPYQTDIGYLEQFCKDLDVQFINRSLEIEVRENHKSPCFFCSWCRRKELFDLTKSLECNKLALGHHRDDTIETLLLNMVFHGSISALPAKLSMFDGRIHLIRPLIGVSEVDIAKYSTIVGYPQQIKTCNLGENNNRYAIKQLLKEIEKLNKNAKINLYNSMSKIFDEYLPPHWD